VLLQFAGRCAADPKDAPKCDCAMPLIADLRVPVSPTRNTEQRIAMKCASGADRSRP
jgi:hypothetical protein